MSNPNQVFPSLYNSVGRPTGKEIDIREEFLSTIFGSSQEIAKSYQMLLRKIDLDGNGKPIKCPCVDRITNEQDKDYFCPVCMSERYTWKEFLVNAYKVQHINDDNLKTQPIGLVSANFAIFYLPYNVDVQKYDKIVEVNLDVEGEFIYPLRRSQIWELTQIVKLRLDTGRIEFNKVFAREDDVRYLNKP